MIKNSKQIFLTLVTVFSLNLIYAQDPGKIKDKFIPQQKFKPPVVKTYWGNNTDSASVAIEEAYQLLSIPIRITDEKKNAYSISSYELLYRKLGVIGLEESETKKIVPTSSIVAQLFKKTPLPEIWVKNISAELKSGEELYFYDVVVKDNLGRIFFAPTLKIKIR